MPNDAITATVALAGLFFSLTCALLLEDLLFGVVFRVMRCSRRLAAAVQPKQMFLNQRGSEDFPITQSQITKSPM